MILFQCIEKSVKQMDGVLSQIGQLESTDQGISIGRFADANLAFKLWGDEVGSIEIAHPVLLLKMAL